VRTGNGSLEEEPPSSHHALVDGLHEGGRQSGTVDDHLAGTDAIQDAVLAVILCTRVCVCVCEVLRMTGSGQGYDKHSQEWQQWQQASRWLCTLLTTAVDASAVESIQKVVAAAVTTSLGVAATVTRSGNSAASCTHASADRFHTTKGAELFCSRFRTMPFPLVSDRQI
jgi:hypothetical protein